jgi:hypothetical protein
METAVGTGNPEFKPSESRNFHSCSSHKNVNWWRGTVSIKDQHKE